MKKKTRIYDPISQGQFRDFHTGRMKMNKLKVVITGIPQEWIGPVRIRELEKKGTSFILRGKYYEIVLENSELAIGILKKECHFIL